MKIYNITLGQLITIWIFGFFLWLWAFAEATGYYSSDIGSVLFILIPAILIFYTIGWRNYQKKDKKSARTNKKGY